MDLGRAFRDATVRSYIMSVIYGIEFSSVISACLPRATRWGWVAASGLVDSFDPGLVGITRYQHFIGSSYLRTTRRVKRTSQELGSGTYFGFLSGIFRQFIATIMIW